MNTYKRINAVKTAISILTLMADQREPVSGRDISLALDLPHGTVMSHLSTLADDRWVRQVGDHWEIGQACALIWARKKAAITANINQLTSELNQLGE